MSRYLIDFSSRLILKALYELQSDTAAVVYLEIRFPEYPNYIN